MEASKPAIIILAHSRTDHLQRVLAAAQQSESFDRHNLIVIVDESAPEVQEIISNPPVPDMVLLVRPAPEDTPMKRINRSLSLSLDLAFGRMKAPHVIVLDDDIVVSPIFLRFVENCHRQYRKNPLFRGINGWSATEDEMHSSDEVQRISRINYGYGWGWSISSRQFENIRSIFNHSKAGNFAPDWLFEQYLRTGFMVNPRQSLIQNIGFDKTATHTNSDTARQLGKLIDTSFGRNLHSAEKLNRPFELSREPFPWASWSPCIEFDRLNPWEKVALIFLSKLIWNTLRAQLMTDGVISLRFEALGSRLRRIRRRFPTTPIDLSSEAVEEDKGLQT